MRWRIFAREPSALFWTYGFPVVLALALGVAFRDRPPEPVEVAVEASPGCEGWRALMRDNPFSMVYVNRDLGTWGGPSIGAVTVKAGDQGPHWKPLLART